MTIVVVVAAAVAATSTAAAAAPAGRSGNCPAATIAQTCSTDVRSQSFYVYISALAEQVNEAALPGDTVFFRVGTTDTGAVPYTDTEPAGYSIDLSDVLDDASYNNDAFAPGGTVSFHNSVLTWTGVPGGFLGSLQFSAQVHDPTGVDYVPGNLVLNAPVVTPTGDGGSCPVGSAELQCSATVPIAEYTAVTTASASSAAQGRRVTYAETLTNIGKADLTPSMPASFSDDLTGVLDDATYDNDASAGATYGASKVSWSGPLEIGTSATFTYSVTVKTPDTGNLDLVNHVSTYFGGSCVGGGEALCSTSTPVQNPPPSGPRAPGLPTVRTPSTYSNGVQLKWGFAPSNGSPVTSYRVVATPGHGAPVVATVPGTDRAYTFLNLTPGTSYNFSVNATNAVGTGPNAYTRAIVGTPGPPTAAGVVNYRGGLQLRWGYGASTGSPITSYVLTCYVPSATGNCGPTFAGADPQLYTRVVPATARAFTFSEVAAHGTYTFYVWAQNKNGASAAPLRVVVTR